MCGPDNYINSARWLSVKVKSSSSGVKSDSWLNLKVKVLSKYLFYSLWLGSCDDGKGIRKQLLLRGVEESQYLGHFFNVILQNYLYWHLFQQKHFPQLFGINPSFTKAPKIPKILNYSVISSPKFCNQPILIVTRDSTKFEVNTKQLSNYHLFGNTSFFYYFIRTCLFFLALHTKKNFHYGLHK